MKTEQKYYEVRRNDGRKIPNYTFDSRDEAQKAIDEMSEPERSPFTYRIVEVAPGQNNPDHE